MFQVPMPLASAEDERLDGLGWSIHDPVHVMVCDIERVLSGTARNTKLPAIEVSETLDDDWLRAYHYRGGRLPPHARAVITAGVGTAFAAVRGDQGVEAIARAAMAQRWVGVTAVEVSPGSRRRGLGTHIMRELVAWAGRAGARHAYLQVAADNATALALYGRMGFTPHHDYHYRVAPGEKQFAI
jgi:GNAT superfamily N-acetyltransferase